MGTVFTIGHSKHAIAYFLELLKRHRINCVVDVRSVAASRFNPQYNKKSLSESLKQQNIAYLHFANEFGARRSAAALLDEDGKVDFEKVRASEDFRGGIKRLKEGIQKGFTIALMCAEAEPLECHRFGMISPALEEEGIEVKHILKTGNLLTNTEVELQMVQKFEKQLHKGTTRKPFRSSSKRAEAYRMLNQKIGYTPGGE
jgi:uncharacterized protein (DUF488 family)